MSRNNEHGGGGGRGAGAGETGGKAEAKRLDAIFLGRERSLSFFVRSRLKGRQHDSNFSPL